MIGTVPHFNASTSGIIDISRVFPPGCICTIRTVETSQPTHKEKAESLQSSPSELSCHSATGRGGKVGIFGFACILGMSYGSRRISTLLIPDKSKPTVTWGRKAMGQHCCFPASAMVVARLPKESSHELVPSMGVALRALVLV